MKKYIIAIIILIVFLIFYLHVDKQTNDLPELSEKQSEEIIKEIKNKLKNDEDIGKYLGDL